MNYAQTQMQGKNSAQYAADPIGKSVGDLEDIARMQSSILENLHQVILQLTGIPIPVEHTNITDGADAPAMVRLSRVRDRIGDLTRQLEISVKDLHQIV